MKKLVNRSLMVLAAATCASLATAESVEAQAAAAATFTESGAARPAETTDDTVWNVQLGSTLNWGNTRSFQLSGGTHFLVRRDIHLFQMDLNFTYGTAATRDAATGRFGEQIENAQNINGKLRYDLFFDPEWTLFAVVAGRRDTFAGLDFRVQGQLGVSRNLFAEAESAHRLWLELGADVTYDDLYYATGSAGGPPSRQHIAGRIYVGYDNHMNSTWRYTMGVEALPGVLMTDATPPGVMPVVGSSSVANVRVNWTNDLQLNLVDNLAIGLKLNLFTEAVTPVIVADDPTTAGNEEVRRENVDVQTILSLQYTLL